MFSPEEQQVEICLLKSNLEEIENEVVVQRSSIPELDAENEEKYRATLTALRVVRFYNTEIENLKQENVRLTANRMQLKRQSDDLAKCLRAARENRMELANLLKQEEHEIEIQIRKYEDSLLEISDRFRNSRRYYVEEEVNKDIDKANNKIAQLEEVLSQKKTAVDDLKKKLDSIHPEVPEQLLEIIGKQELDDKVKSLMKKCNDLVEKRRFIF